MGGTASVAKDQGNAKASGSAAKYEEKPTASNDGSKGSNEKPQSTESKTVATDIAEPKSAPSEPVVQQPQAMEDKSIPPPLQDNSTQPSAYIDEARDQFPDPSERLIRNDHSASQIALFTVGDFVKVKQEDGTYAEGLLLEVLNEERVVVDFGGGEVVKQCLAADIELVVPSDVMEEGDQVQVQPVGSAMYFVGKITQINADGTYDVVMEGDDPDDIERHVPDTNIRKLMSRRALVIARWKRAALVVSSIHNFQSFALDANQYSGSNRKPSMFAASVKMGAAPSLAATSEG